MYQDLNIELSNRQQKLFEYISDKFSGINRKYTNVPYLTHLHNVGLISHKYGLSGLDYEVGLSHDLLEDIKSVTFIDFYNKLIIIGYDETEALYIANGVWYLTNYFTSKRYPIKNRSWRKNREAQRLLDIPISYQINKIADIYDNVFHIDNMFFSNRKFAMLYLDEKLNLMNMISSAALVKSELVDITIDLINKYR